MPEEAATVDLRGYDPSWIGIPSVTEVLSRAGLIPDMSFVDDFYKDRGRGVHKMVELYEKGTLDLESLDPQLACYLPGWVSFKRNTGWVTLGCETPMRHPTLNYRGKPDIWGRLHGKLTLLDLKAGAQAPWHYYQCASYQELLRQHGQRIMASFPLYLSADGKYKLGSRRASREDWQIFLNALNKIERETKV